MRQYSIQFPEEIDILLSRLAIEKKKEKYEIIELALKTYAYLYDQAKQSGNELSITYINDGKKINVILP